MNGQFSDRMNQSDTTLWRIEHDPKLRTTIVGVTVLEAPPEWEQLRSRVERVSLQIPRLRQRVSDPFGFGAPHWVIDPHFELDDHLSRIVAPHPGDLRTVLDLAEPMAMEPFDRSRPLWELVLVEGLADGRAAIIHKLHHSLTDGVGAIRMARLLVDEYDGPPPDRSAVAPRPAAEMVLDRATHAALDAMRFAGHAAVAVPQAVVGAVEHPVHTVEEIAHTVESIGKLVRPAREPLSPLMRGRGTSRRLAAISMPLDELRAAAKAADGTLNDAFLAAVAIGMRRYHERHSAPLTALRVTMPINVRTDADTLGNNRFVPVRFALPVSSDDPVEQMRCLGGLARAWRGEPGLQHANSIAGALNVLPRTTTTAVMRSLLSAVDLVVTNVPGLEHEEHLAGSRIEAQYAFAPPSGAALSVALLSHHDSCSVGLTMDTAAVPDPEVLAACIAEGFDEVLATGRRVTHRRARRASPAAHRTPALPHPATR